MGNGFAIERLLCACIVAPTESPPPPPQKWEIFSSALLWNREFNVKIHHKYRVHKTWALRNTWGGHRHHRAHIRHFARRNAIEKHCIRCGNFILMINYFRFCMDSIEFECKRCAICVKDCPLRSMLQVLSLVFAAQALLLNKAAKSLRNAVQFNLVV